MDKPVIVILPNSTDEQAVWASDGWFRQDQQGTSKAQELMRKAKECFKKSETLDEAMENLEKAGFEVDDQRWPDPVAPFSNN